MGYNSALAGGETTALALNGHTVRAYLSAHHSAVLATAQFDGAGGTTPAAGVLPIKNATGGWLTGAAIRGQTLRITSSITAPNKRYLRLRDTPVSATSVKVNENSYFDPGLIPVETYLYSFANWANDGDTVEVLDRMDLWTHLPRISGSNIYEDWDSSSYAAYNFNPQPIANAGKHVSTFVDAGQTYATLTFTMSPIWLNPLTIHATTPYTWTIPGSWTVTSGSSTSASFTAQVPAGEYMLRCIVLSAQGTLTIAFRKVWVHDYASNAPIGIAQVSGDTRDLSGRRMKVRILDSDLSGIEPGVMVNYWEVASWGGSDVATATTNFTGFVLSVNYVMQAGVRYAELAIGGPAEVMKRMGGFSQWIEAAVTPASYQQCTTSLSYVDAIIVYMLTLRAPNVLALFDHNPMTTSNLYLAPYWKINQGSLYDQIKSLAEAQACNYGFDSRGAAWVTRHPSLSTYAAPDVGSGLNIQAKRFTITPTMMTEVTGERQDRPHTRRVRGECFKALGTVGAVPKVAVCEAPSMSFGQGASDKQMGGMILQGSAELQMIVGGEYARENNPWPSVSVKLAGNYDVIEPCIQNPVGLQVDASMSPDAVAWDKQGVVTRVSKRLTANGEVEMSYDMEMLAFWGLAGVTMETF